ncbi:agmatine deiminase family protein [Bifidobacterium callimiconis]|uniref:agmatine deiminase family protein n=1 Tax=Bifidobacterium callimiconis TaxID=2306973 RepID=UPI001BDCA673|nr:agmatine deiminase family protein [Bifidobacterium callimiconis]MBT1178024.1 agmatine deiminase family protein [Bifidobacterium callimiconis]
MPTIMPAETHRHERTWMSFPTEGYVLGNTKESRSEAIRMWSSVANAIVKYEPVSMVVDPALESVAKDVLDDGVTTHPFPLNDCWMRDSGPTFVIDHGTNGATTLKAVDWVFNGWGQQEWSAWDKDALLARHVAEEAGVGVIDSSYVFEGGGFHVDGEGTAILTETVALDPHRNPGRTREDIERELHRTLGVNKVIWLPRGLTRDYGEFGTRGHVDIVACMPQPGVVLFHDQRNPDHPDYQVSRDIERVLSQARDARGRQLTVVPIPAPAQGFEDDGTPTDFSYINHYAANGAVIACTFNDPNDDQAMTVLSQAYPGRTVVPISSKPLFDRGGGIHCITQQQPALSE